MGGVLYYNKVCGGNIIILNIYTDYRVNQNQYIFSNDILALPIGIQLTEDRSGEGIESFNLTLLVLPNSQPMSADIISPSSVTVIIIDDDCT